MSNWCFKLYYWFYFFHPLKIEKKTNKKTVQGHQQAQINLLVIIGRGVSQAPLRNLFRHSIYSRIPPVTDCIANFFPAMKFPSIHSLTLCKWLTHLSVTDSCRIGNVTININVSKWTDTVIILPTLLLSLLLWISILTSCFKLYYWFYIWH
jgi:hypothetical protein